MLSVQDSATTEESEKVLQPDNVMGPESASNLLSSGKFGYNATRCVAVRYSTRTLFNSVKHNFVNIHTLKFIVRTFISLQLL